MAGKNFRDRGADLARKVAPGSMAGEAGGSLEARVARLNNRITELEAEMQENRQLHVRVAELTDVVQELLLPLSQRDNERIEAVLTRYADTI